MRIVEFIRVGNARRLTTPRLARKRAD